MDMRVAFLCLPFVAVALADCQAACESETEDTALLQVHDSKGSNLQAQDDEWRRYGRWHRYGVVPAPPPPPATTTPAPAPAPCPYHFGPQACEDAEPQTPRDLSTGATGEMTPKAATLTDDQASFLPLTNVHFHCGAEHKSDSYKNDADSLAYDASPDAGPRPGFMCPIDTLAPENLTSYNFSYCHGVKVGKSYEVHYVHSSAGTFAGENDTNLDIMQDGLGLAANGRGLLNPMVVVQAQVFQIVQGGPVIDDLLHGWTVVGHDNSVMYSGSTTGTSFNNSVCSPYVITWHVDKDCHAVSPESFDNFCKQMIEVYNFSSDFKPKGSRTLVDPKYTVKPEFVLPLK